MNDRYTQNGGETRRDFLNMATGGMAVVGAGFASWPLIDSMKPAADILALAEIEADLTPIEIGQRITLSWQGRPVFVMHRTGKEIEQAHEGDLAALPDPAKDRERVQSEEWLVVIGICTHLGCVPLGQRQGSPIGEYGGWFCPCHGSHYDTSGRIRRGPAPRNLDIPPYQILENGILKVGTA